MKIKSKLLWMSFGTSVLVALMGALAVNRQHEAATIAATHEAGNVARILGLFLSNAPSSSAPAQEIISRLNEAEKRDAVLVDTKQVILADTVLTDVGKTYTEDKGHEVRATLQDGRPRTFVENSSDSPLPMKQVVVPVHDRFGHIIGAVILEYTPLYEALIQSISGLSRQVVWVGIVSAVIALCVTYYVGRSITVPIEQLRSAATGFAAGRTDSPMPPPRADEIGDLARAFDHMRQMRQDAETHLRVALDNMETCVQDRTRELETTHQQLLETSDRAGMAEVATSVLHNVGNVLNSVNVASACLTDGVRKSKGASLTRVVSILREHESDLTGFFASDPRARHFPAFLAELSDFLADERAAALAELGQLQKNVDHIKEIVTMQQACAKISGKRETVQMAGLIEDALRMNAQALAHSGVRVVREFGDAPPITVEKHKVLQILVNLVRNAKQACVATGQPNRALTLRILHGEGRVQASVSDNGVGIPPENLALIFHHGFTTKKNGHGFGLRSCVLAAIDLGGALRAESNGVGEGAIFTLELPVAKPPECHV